MSKTYCPQCGYANDAEARFCMDCGYRLESNVQQAGGQQLAGGTAAPASREHEGTDWASIVAAVLAFLSLRRASRKARGMTVVIVFLVLFFGCPLVCGLIGLVVQWFGNLFQ
jgi:uncharacterized membrane protein YvbJ